MSSVVVTGANGFIGRALCRHLVASGHSVRGDCS
ncbi:NAD-dependent epimerase/dehydratase family protein [Pseudomonas aeruginosa]|nr:NAD(P)-dependent oxidoreductase [Pseudomonas aeruginosa]